MSQPDSRDVAPGYLFIAVTGTKADGMAFAAKAVAAGAVAVLGQHRVGSSRSSKPPQCSFSRIVEKKMVSGKRTIGTGALERWITRLSPALNVQPT